MSVHRKNNWLHRAVDLLFPRRCPFCGAVTEGGALLCAACAAKLPFTGEHAVKEGTYGRCAAPLYYEETVRRAVLDLKFHGRLGVVACCADLMAQCAAEAYAGEFDTVSWVPVSDKRRRERGFDQAEELCRALCRLWDTQPTPTLHKTQDNRAQSSLTAAEERRGNVLGVYEALAPNVWGRRILLVDDVMTTGSTLSECVRVLREAGAAEVLCLTFSRVR